MTGLAPSTHRSTTNISGGPPTEALHEGEGNPGQIDQPAIMPCERPGKKEPPMRNVIYAMSISLDGYIAGPGGELDWSAPDEELFTFHTERVAEQGLQVCGRGLYEAMLYWETAAQNPSASGFELEFARIWTALPKLVASTTLQTAQGNYRLVADNVAGEVATLKQQPGKDIGVGGAGLAATLIRSGLVDDFRLFVIPIVLGAGIPYFPALDRRLDLDLVETRTFGSKVVYLRYQAAR